MKKKHTRARGLHFLWFVATIGALAGAAEGPAPRGKAAQPAKTPVQSPNNGHIRDLFADTWVATDALGRALPGRAVCGPPRPDKFVAMFYWTWHLPKINPGDHGAHDNTRIIDKALAEGRTPHWPPYRANYFWGEPELGYYQTTDPFVLRKHASMLADAGVDAIVFDTTNPPFTWKKGYMALCKEFSAMRRAGNRTPGIAFMCPFGDPTVVVKRIFEELYRPGLYRGLWFIWKGKPLILADPRYFRSMSEISGFFTFRKPIPGYWTRPDRPGEWPWLQVYPQHGFPDEKGRIEATAVGVAQNAIPGAYGPAPMSHRKGAMGRSWHGGARDPNPEAVSYGLNFQEQWTRALALDPEVVFVTGWNEWTASRLPKFGPYNENDDPYYPGGLFVDEYNQEYSRDIEPMKGGHTDCYYYQLVAWVRRFKGVRNRPLPEGPSRIAIDGTFEDWDAVVPEFRDTVGDTIHRNHPGYGGAVYTNDTGRNDIVLCKIAYDAENIYFFAQTRTPLTSATDRNWMLLFLDTDQDPATGWHGYDFLVNADRDPVRHSSTVVRLARAGGAWEVVGNAVFRVAANRLELAIPRQFLGETGAAAPALDFHWADNIQRIAIEEFGVNGDSAPNRRFNYRYGPPPKRAPSHNLGYFPEYLRRGSKGTANFPPAELFQFRRVFWVWRSGVKDARATAPIETVRFRRHFRLTPEQARGKAYVVLVADNLAEVSVNGMSRGVVTGWDPPVGFAISLKSGENRIEVTVGNTGNAPNPAGLALQVGVLRPDAVLDILARTGDGKWEAALKPEKNDGKRSTPVWESAKKLGPVGCAPWGSMR